jgi:hypothetical protein
MRLSKPLLMALVNSMLVSVGAMCQSVPCTVYNWERAVSQVIDTVTSVVRGYDSVRKPRELLLQSKIGCHKFTSAGGCGSGRESMWGLNEPSSMHGLEATLDLGRNIGIGQSVSQLFLS